MKLKRSNYPLNTNNKNNMNINTNKWLNRLPSHPNGLNPYEGWLKNYNRTKIFKPRMDITEETDHYIIHADLPGLTKDNVRMELTDNGILTISGERKWNYQTSFPSENQNQNQNQNQTNNNNNLMSSPSIPEENKLNDKYSRNAYYKRIERSFGQFKRSFTLPDDIDSSNIEAKMENGVLIIKLPKNLNNSSKKDVKLITVQ
ncbi:HSP20-like chaperone [Neocallimastix lanati (nom. inval.)]|nr:HSP20-like chaperone [Neocallimastix sp. JGI-2020a]